MKSLMLACVCALVFAACGEMPTSPTHSQSVKPSSTESKIPVPDNPYVDEPIQQPVFITLTAAKTGSVNVVMIEADDPQLPTCAGRDLVVARHVASGGERNDIFTLSDGHQVYLVDRWYHPYYVVEDYRTPWCQ